VFCHEFLKLLLAVHALLPIGSVGFGKIRDLLMEILAILSGHQHHMLKLWIHHVTVRVHCITCLVQKSLTARPLLDFFAQYRLFLVVALLLKLQRLHVRLVHLFELVGAHLLLVEQRLEPLQLNLKLRLLLSALLSNLGLLSSAEHAAEDSNNLVMLLIVKRA
jgi:hypothetical protein